eukprot:EG_transcript_2707
MTDGPVPGPLPSPGGREPPAKRARRTENPASPVSSNSNNGPRPIRPRPPIAVQSRAHVFDLRLKPDHVHRPLWVTAAGTPLRITVYLETFSPLYAEAAAFLSAIAEPVTRPFFVHEYHVTGASLYTAVSIGMSPASILATLGKLSKVLLPARLTTFIHEQAEAFGKAVLVLRGGRYFIQSRRPEVIDQLRGDADISQGLVGAVRQHSEELQEEAGEDEDEAEEDRQGELQFLASARRTTVTVHEVEVDGGAVQRVKQRAAEAGVPLLNEYDFRHDATVEDIELELRERARIRNYQRRGLTKMFGNGRARSGIIVLPCGAGKTFVGITACCTVKKAALVLCSCALAVEQWRVQFKQWSTLPDARLMRFTAKTKDPITDHTNVVITTYNMIAHTGTRSKASQALLSKIRSRVWGLVVLDEVHVVPSDMFRRVLSLTRFHTALGLTATLVREDGKITDLSFLIGPKLYEANWWELVAAGDLARVECCEVHCPMTKEFYRYYITRTLPWQQRLLAIMNPAKLQACQYIMRFHEALGDKVLVFCDDVFALLTYAKALDRPYVYGATPLKERLRILSEFRHSPDLKTLFISKIGDQAIDLPEATVIIQVASHFGSRRQEAQRLGRILRPKPQVDATATKGGFRSVSEALAGAGTRPVPDGAALTLQQRRLLRAEAAASSAGPNAFFYSLVSGDTQEMYFSTKRQGFLVDQGYSFRVLTGVPPPGQEAQVYATREAQVDLLTKVLAVTTDTLEADPDDAAEDSDGESTAPRRKAPAPKLSATRRPASMAELSGAGDLLYTEYTAAPAKPAAPARLRSPLLAGSGASAAASSSSSLSPSSTPHPLISAQNANCIDLCGD